MTFDSHTHMNIFAVSCARTILRKEERPVKGEICDRKNCQDKRFRPEKRVQAGISAV